MIRFLTEIWFSKISAMNYSIVFFNQFINYFPPPFSFGDLDSEHARTLAVSKACQAIAITIDYRLAPEHPYPAAINDFINAS